MRILGTDTKVVLFDLDGTIADLTHRLHHIKQDPQDWEAFFQECGQDILHVWAKDLMIALRDAGYLIYIVSGRPERTRVKTMNWLEAHDIPYFGLVLVRGDGNHAPDELLKENWFKKFPLKDKVAFVVDDRQRVVDMWRRNGLVCLQCDAWPELAKPYPTEAKK